MLCLLLRVISHICVYWSTCVWLHSAIIHSQEVSELLQSLWDFFLKYKSMVVTFYITEAMVTHNHRNIIVKQLFNFISDLAFHHTVSAKINICCVIIVPVFSPAFSPLHDLKNFFVFLLTWEIDANSDTLSHRAVPRVCASTHAENTFTQSHTTKA